MAWQIKYLGADQLASLLRDSQNLAQTLVIDVRDHVSSKMPEDHSPFNSAKQACDFQDFGGGHIRNCVNLITDEFEDDDDVDSLIEKYCHGKERLVFHCMMSQKRGPFCARRLAGRLALAEISHKPDVCILEGGFKHFRSAYPELCDDLE